MTKERWLEDAFRGELDIRHTSHPPDAVLLGDGWDLLEEDERKTVRLHVATCDRCRSRRAELAGRPAWTTRPRFLRDPVAMTFAGRCREVLRVCRIGRVSRVGPRSVPVRRAILVYAGAMASVALLIGVTHIVLDLLLVSPTSPFATPVPRGRWWVHLYWILVPVAMLAVGRVARAVRRSRRDGGTSRS